MLNCLFCWNYDYQLLWWVEICWEWKPDCWYPALAWWWNRWRDREHFLQWGHRGRLGHWDTLLWWKSLGTHSIIGILETTQTRIPDSQTVHIWVGAFRVFIVTQWKRLSQIKWRRISRAALIVGDGGVEQWRRVLWEQLGRCYFLCVLRHFCIFFAICVVFCTILCVFCTIFCLPFLLKNCAAIFWKYYFPFNFGNISAAISAWQ